MRCDQAKKLIADYLYQEMPDAQERALEEHLAHCWGCNHELQSLQETLTLVTSHIAESEDELAWQNSWTDIQAQLSPLRARIEDQSTLTRRWRAFMNRISTLHWPLIALVPGKTVAVLGALALAIGLSIFLLNRTHVEAPSDHQSVDALMAETKNGASEGIEKHTDAAMERRMEQPQLPHEAAGRGIALNPSTRNPQAGSLATIVGPRDAPYGTIRAAVLSHRSTVSQPVTPEILAALRAYSGLKIDARQLTADDKDLQSCVWVFIEGDDSVDWSRPSQDALRRYAAQGGFLIVVSHQTKFQESVVKAVGLDLKPLLDALQAPQIAQLAQPFQAISDRPISLLLADSDARVVGLVLPPSEAYVWNRMPERNPLDQLTQAMLNQLADSALIQWYPEVPVRMRGTLEQDTLRLQATLASPGVEAEAKLTTELRIPADGEDKARHQTQIRHVALKPDVEERAEMDFHLADDQLTRAYVAYVLETPHYTYQQTRAVRDLVPDLDTRLIGQTRWQSGSPASFRVIARDHATQQPVRGAFVLASLVTGYKPHPVFEGHTDATGSVDVRIPAKQIPLGDTKLHVEVNSKQGRDNFTQDIKVETQRKVLLSTDKPIYQPGQTMHLRSLSLNSADRTPIANTDVTLEVEDAKGNKVYKQSGKTDRFGIFASDFVLADEVNQGRYTARVVLADTIQEKKINVERYVLPKFKIVFETDQPYYQPGDTVKGEVQADYFFGKPVTEGQVEVRASKFDVGFDEFASVQGETDAEGHYSFEFELPDAFVGQPLEQGNAFAQFEVSVVDGGEHKETVSQQRQVVRSPIRILAVPESTTLDADMEGLLFVMTTSPDSKPLETEVTWQSDAGKQMQSTDALGIVTFHVRGGEQGTITARDAQGHEATQQVTLQRGEALIVRTNHPIYRVGDTVEIEVIASQQQGTVYVDLIRAKQTLLTRSVRLQDGRGKCEVGLTAADAGTLTLHAYQITPGSEMMRDTRYLYVDPADDLQVDVRADKQSYLPGEEATLNVRVSDPYGHPVLAALGLWVVDESVFALQEMQPGLEKVYFTLEKELLKPRYEIHGFEMDDIVREPLTKREQRESAARVLLTAAAREAPEYSLNVRSYDQKRVTQQKRRQEQVTPRALRIAQALESYQQKHGWNLVLTMEDLVQAGELQSQEASDPWGHEFYLGADALYSVGPDGRLNTEDDVRIESVQSERGPNKGIRRGGAMEFRRGRERILSLARPAPMAIAENGIMLGDAISTTLAPEEAATRFSVGLPAMATSQPVGGAGVTVPVPEPRIRRYFPETLFTEAALITDAQGRARFTIPLADSITTWRLTGMASSLNGELGSTTSNIRVFQDFFVDIDLPVSLTQNDEVSIPIVVYNYLPGEQDIQLKLTQEPWFELLGEAEQTLSLQENQVRVRYYRIRVKQLGWHTLTVHAYGSKMSDAIARQIEITPDGKQHLVSYSDRLSDETTQVIDIPAQAVEGASKILVKLYPGTFSQILEGMDSILQMPFGCFEQTSSTTYPNILALDYIRSTEKSTPEVEMKAHQYINLGYQRLLSFEVEGGGFEWFGNAPANRILTAYGLMEFHDMAQVHEIDAAVIQRTQQWLMQQQGEDGSWEPDKAYLHAESWGRIQNSNLLPTAYITWALLESQAQENAVQKGIDYIRQHRSEAKDAYTLGIIANALVRADRNDDSTFEVIQQLRKMAVEDKDTAHWTSSLQTVTYSHGGAADTETTAMITQALLLYGREAKITNKALTYLVRAKDPNGTWGSTQATILALKALLMASEGAQTEADATVRLFHNGAEIEQIRITPDTSDLMRLVDLGKVTKKGKNELRLTWEGEGNCLYQVVGRYYLPWKDERAQSQSLGIKVEYDKQKLTTDDLITCKVRVENLQSRTANMVIVDLGIPPGFEVLTPDLTELIGEYGIQKYDLTSRQVILYFDKLASNKPVEFEYRLRAKFPIKAQTRTSRVYEYYNPDVTAMVAPVELVVE